MQKEGIQKFVAITALGRKIADNPSDVKLLRELQDKIQSSPGWFVKAAREPLIACFYPYLKIAKGNNNSFKENERQLLVATLNELLNKIIIEHSQIFFNFALFLVVELYDYEKDNIRPTSEEYKIATLSCMLSLIKSISLDLLEDLYVKENTPKFSQIIYTCCSLFQKPIAKNIRTMAIECIMAVARVLNDDDLADTVLRYKCADVFVFFLPGLCSSLPKVALEDLRVGHVLPMTAIRAYGRIITLVMQNYNPQNQNFNIKDLLLEDTANGEIDSSGVLIKEDINAYLNKVVRNFQWYKKTDKQLTSSLKLMEKLTYHSHRKIRLEMVSMAAGIVDKCLTTAPQSSCVVIGYLIVLSQDLDEEVAADSTKVLSNLSERLTQEDLNALFDHLEDEFYNTISSLPRKFNSIDDAEKVATLNLLTGYIKLFGKYKMSNVLLSPNMLSQLVKGLLHIGELEKSKISLLEEYTLRDLSSESTTFKSPWINFHYFQQDSVKQGLDSLCKELTRNNCLDLVYDSLQQYGGDRKKEALYLTNSLVSGIECVNEQYLPLLKSILNSYSEDPLNELECSLRTDEYSLEEVQDNVIMICLMTEGLGIISITLKQQFQFFLLKTLYLVLEKAGSGHPLIRTAGLLALKNITDSCGYKDITELINSNFDFFSYHVQRKLVKLEEKEGVLNVLSVVLQYSSVDVLLPMKHIIDEVLVISCDRFKEKYATGYLKVFKMFITSLRRWYNVQVVTEPFKSRKQKEMDEEPFKVSGVDYSNNFSDEIMEGKTAEELYKEDMEKKKRQEESGEDQYDPEDEPYTKPTPPVHVELTVLILKRSLHFLPSKNLTRKLLVLEILEQGIEILREWEDELLPVVHQVWHPLVQRFKEINEPLIMRLSVRLVATLARLSKYFIRMRVVKELLPQLKTILEQSARESYLKDKGSSYRYNQAYKLQKELLSCIGPILYYLDVEPDRINEVIDCVHFYLSDKQPQELQIAVIDFFKVMCIYDLETIKAKLPWLQAKSGDYSKNLELIHKYIEENTKNA